MTARGDTRLHFIETATGVTSLSRKKCVTSMPGTKDLILSVTARRIFLLWLTQSLFIIMLRAGKKKKKKLDGILPEILKNISSKCISSGLVIFF